MVVRNNMYLAIRFVFNLGIMAQSVVSVSTKNFQVVLSMLNLHGKTKPPNGHPTPIAYTLIYGTPPTSSGGSTLAGPSTKYLNSTVFR